jgi:hypothetical protein
MDAWQAALEDVGPAGVDKGKGGKYLVLPPGYADRTPDGYIPLPSMTYHGYALLRSILASGSDADVAKAVAYARQIKLYPLSQVANPLATTFVDAIDVVYDATIPYDVRFFESLNRVVQIEPWLTRDKVMIDMLKAIGIEKGKPFNPMRRPGTSSTRRRREPRRGSMRATTPAIRTSMTAANGRSRPRRNAGLERCGRPEGSCRCSQTSLIVTATGWGLNPQKDAVYLNVTPARNDGATRYRLRFKDVPVDGFWSTSVYAEGFFVKNAFDAYTLNSITAKKDVDGSVTVNFGGCDGNRLNCLPITKDWNYMVRLYRPRPEILEGTWKFPAAQLLV